MRKENEGTEVVDEKVGHKKGDASNDGDSPKAASELSEAEASDAEIEAIGDAPNEHPAVEEDEQASDEKVEFDMSTLPDEARQKVEALQAEIERLSKPRRVASGSKPRPNVVYTLLQHKPKWTDTPQVNQIEQILFAPGVPKQMTEPEIFEKIREGHAKGILRTKQNPVRIFQYYRSDLVAANVLRYK